MWRTCYWHWAFDRAPAGPLNLRGSPWEQHCRAEGFSTVNVQPLLISAEKPLDSLNSTPTFAAARRLWMVSQKTVHTLSCLSFSRLPPLLHPPTLFTKFGKAEQGIKPEWNYSLSDRFTWWSSLDALSYINFISLNIINNLNPLFFMKEKFKFTFGLMLNLNNIFPHSTITAIRVLHLKTLYQDWCS